MADRLSSPNLLCPPTSPSHGSAGVKQFTLSPSHGDGYPASPSRRLRAFKSRSSDPAVHQSWAPKLLGEATHDSPLESVFEFEDEHQKQYLDIVDCVQKSEDGLTSRGQIISGADLPDCGKPIMVEMAGPRKKIFFDPKNTTVGIVTCGGLSPGLNNVIRALVLCLWHRYGVRNFLGFRFGYEGLIPEGNIMRLTPDLVRNIHSQGGTILGTSRGPQDPIVMAKNLAAKDVDILFTLGGDGTLRGALSITKALEEIKQKVSVVGIPKTIDNDISFTDRTFGFDTAVDVASKTISSIHNEATSHKGGIGIVKLMGRHSGFIALHASIASGDANVVLLPEINFTWEGLGKYLTHRFTELKKNDVVIVVAEGAGQDLLETQNSHQKDASGNEKLVDIGLAVKNFVSSHMKSLKLDFTIKYVDPAYIIRSSQANTSDALYCIHLAQMAAHAAMAGRTEIVISKMHGSFVHVPIAKAVEARKNIDPNGWLYETLLDATGQPSLM